MGAPPADGEGVGAVPLRRTPRQARSKARLARVLAAAERVLVEEGVEALTTTRVAAEARVSVGSLYQYLPDRNAIIDALASDYFARLEAVMEDLVREAAEHSDSERSDSEHSDSEHSDSDHSGSDRSGSDHSGSEHSGPGQSGPDHSGPERVGADRRWDDPVGVLVDAYAGIYRTEHGFRALWFGSGLTERTRAADREHKLRMADGIHRVLLGLGIAGDEALGRACHAAVLAADALAQEAFRRDARGDADLLDEAKTMLRGYLAAVMARSPRH